MRTNRRSLVLATTTGVLTREVLLKSIQDPGSVTKEALVFALSQQQKDGSIGGFYVSPWTMMALNKLDGSYYFEVSGLTNARERLLGYLVSRSLTFVNGDEEEQLTRTSWATEGIRILLSTSWVELGEDLSQEVWQKSLRLASIRRARRDSYTVWRACLITLMQRYGRVEETIYQDLLGDLRVFRKTDGGWSEGNLPTSYIDHTAAVMMALDLVDRGFFESRRDQETGGFLGPGNLPSVESTSWAILALEEDRVGVDFLIGHQQSDGSISLYGSNNPQTKIWPTVLALSALNGAGF